MTQRRIPMTAGIFGQHWVEEGLDLGQPFDERH